VSSGKPRTNQQSSCHTRRAPPANFPPAKTAKYVLRRLAIVQEAGEIINKLLLKCNKKNEESKFFCA
jgi:hypothetical protein